MGFLSYGRNHFRPFDLTSWQAKAGLFWGNKQPFPGSRQKRTERRRQVVETPAAEGKHSSEAKGLAPEPESEEDERDLFAPVCVVRCSLVLDRPRPVPVTSYRASVVEKKRR